MNTTWNTEDAREAYALEHWSAGFFNVGRDGLLTVTVADQPAAAITDIIMAAQHKGLRLPALLRFPQILEQRVTDMRSAFQHAMQKHYSSSQYTPIYPIKVNQQRSVVQSLVNDAGCGLEVGSKPELIAALSMSRPDGLIICNGYKDHAYIELALLAQRLGLNVIIVIEKPDELRHIQQLAESLAIQPHLGLRMRLMSLGNGKWQNTGGERAKFGLGTNQLLELLNALQAAGQSNWLRLLHFHMGSQIANLNDIRRGVKEAGRYLQAIYHADCTLDYIDIGGGLGVDYEGSRSRSSCSMNYTIEQYANCVIEELSKSCLSLDIQLPHILTESGRALTAHHAVIVTPVVATEHMPEWNGDTTSSDHHPLLENLHSNIANADNIQPEELWLEAGSIRSQAQQAFIDGSLTLAVRSELDCCYFHLLRLILNRLDNRQRRHRQLAEKLQLLLADKYFINLSIFQSLPDIWALDQVFPIMPLQRLDQEPQRYAVLEDLTCDSDGRIDHYVDFTGIESTLRIHATSPDEDYLLGIFLSGAYQETLGDMHNLFGDTDTIDVRLHNEGIHISNLQHGESASDMLGSVGYESHELASRIKAKIDASSLNDDQKSDTTNVLTASLLDYTYLETHTK